MAKSGEAPVIAACEHCGTTFASRYAAKTHRCGAFAKVMTATPQFDGLERIGRVSYASDRYRKT